MSSSPGAASSRDQLVSDVRQAFTTIAVLLGTGILGLPIKLVESGFGPFAFVLTVVFLMQVAVVYISAALLQYATARIAYLASSGGPTKRLPPASTPAPAPHLTADLHTMGRLYLPPGLARAFDFAVLLTFVSTLISYALAGAGAYGSLVGATSPEGLRGVITPFVLACTLAVIFAGKIIAPLVSVLTIVKVLLLVVIIGLCGKVASESGIAPHSSWAADDVAQPFLVATVAIGGIADLMPVMFEGVRQGSRSAVQHFRLSIVAGVGACFVLNLCWSHFVLGIVPQTRADAAGDGVNVSLEAAADAGQIATIPVSQVIDARYAGKYGWFATAITAFITLSITVSFNAIGLGLKHVLDGVVAGLVGGGSGGGGESPHEKGAGEEGGVSGASSSSLFRLRLPSLPTDREGWVFLGARGAVYTVAYGTVLGVALADPAGFLSVLETATSMALNMAGGVFVVLMYANARRRHDEAAARLARAGTGAYLPDPVLPLPRGLGTLLALFVLFTFSFAVLYDVHQAICKALPDVSGGWVTGIAVLALWASIVKPTLQVLFAGSKGGGGDWEGEEGEEDPADTAGAASSSSSSTTMGEGTSLLAGARAHAAASAAPSVPGAGLATGVVGAPSSSTARTLSRSLFFFVVAHFLSLYDAAVLGTVAWTHAGTGGELSEGIAGLAITMVLCHQLLRGGRGDRHVARVLARLLGVEEEGRRKGTAAASSPSSKSSGVETVFAGLLAVVTDGCGPLAISITSFVLGQTGAAAVQLLLAALSGGLLMARGLAWCGLGGGGGGEPLET
jgi:amino acid permease